MSTFNPEEILAFVRAQLDEDERLALDAGGRRWRREAIGCVVDAADNGLIVYGEGTPSSEQSDHIVRHDPARTLLKVAAERRELDEIESMLGGDPYQEGKCAVDLLRLRALPYADCEGYRPEWRPS